MPHDDERDIDERSHRFYVDVLGFVDSIPRGPKSDRLVEQLVGAAGSIGGNRAEALGASSYREFIRYNEVSLRGAKESARWLRACVAARVGTLHQAIGLLEEARQLARILGKIVVTSKRRSGLLPPDGPIGSDSG